MSIHNHIQKGFLQSHIWYNSCFRKIPFKDPLGYGYIFLNEKLIPDFETEIIPEDFPLPCYCQKCARDAHAENKKIPCCEFCKSQRNSSCKNPES